MYNFALIVDIAYAYWNKESHAQNHTDLRNWPRWRDSARSQHRDHSKHKTFYASGSLTESVLLLPAPHIHSLGAGFGSQETEAVFLFVTVPGDRIQEWAHHHTVLSLTLWGALKQQRIWTTLHFFELKVPQQLCQLSRRQSKLSTSYKDAICSTEISSTF